MREDVVEQNGDLLNHDKAYEDMTYDELAEKAAEIENEIRIIENEIRLTKNETEREEETELTFRKENLEKELSIVQSWMIEKESADKNLEVKE